MAGLWCVWVCSLFASLILPPPLHYAHKGVQGGKSKTTKTRKWIGERWNMPETRILFIYSNVTHTTIYYSSFSFRSIHASSSSSFCSKSNQVCVCGEQQGAVIVRVIFSNAIDPPSSVVKWLPTAAKRSQPQPPRWTHVHITSFSAAKIPCSDSYRHTYSLWALIARTYFIRV